MTRSSSPAIMTTPHSLAKGVRPMSDRRGFQELVRYRYLPDLVKRHRCKRIIEIGTFAGRSAVAMINAARSVDDRIDNVYYHGFDLWEQMTEEIHAHEVSKKPPSKHMVEMHLKRTGANINLYQGDTKETLPEFVRNNPVPNPDFVFIDGGHSFETVASDWENVQKIAGPRTVLVLDDYTVYSDDQEVAFGCNRVVDTLDQDEWTVEVLDGHDTFGARSVYFVKVMRR